jgi:hypothetical protein
MKGHKRHHKAGGGKLETPQKGADTYEEDLKDKPERYTKGKPEDEAEERKHGGRAKRKHGGMVHHLGKQHGKKPHQHAGRKPRKAGGRAGSDSHPLSSAHSGKHPYSTTEID